MKYASTKLLHTVVHAATVCAMKQTKRSDKLSISMDKDLVAWLRRAAAKRRSSVSQVIEECVLPRFERRHAK